MYIFIYIYFYLICRYPQSEVARQGRGTSGPRTLGSCLGYQSVAPCIHPPWPFLSELLFRRWGCKPQRSLSLLVCLLQHAGNTRVVFLLAPTPGLRGKKRSCSRIGTGKSEELQQKGGTVVVRKGPSIPLWPEKGLQTIDKYCVTLVRRVVTKVPKVSAVYEIYSQYPSTGVILIN